MKFLGHLCLHGLKHTSLNEPTGDEDEDEKNAEVYTALIQFLDNKSLLLIMREAADDGHGDRWFSKNITPVKESFELLW